jgi:hypothetical protein
MAIMPVLSSRSRVLYTAYRQDLSTRLAADPNGLPFEIRVELIHHEYGLV